MSAATAVAAVGTDPGPTAPSRPASALEADVAALGERGTRLARWGRVGLLATLALGGLAAAAWSAAHVWFQVSPAVSSVDLPSSLLSSLSNTSIQLVGGGPVSSIGGAINGAFSSAVEVFTNAATALVEYALLPGSLLLAAWRLAMGKAESLASAASPVMGALGMMAMVFVMQTVFGSDSSSAQSERQAVIEAAEKADTPTLRSMLASKDPAELGYVSGQSLLLQAKRASTTLDQSQKEQLAAAARAVDGALPAWRLEWKPQRVYAIDLAAHGHAVSPAALQYLSETQSRHTVAVVAGSVAASLAALLGLGGGGLSLLGFGMRRRSDALRALLRRNDPPPAPSIPPPTLVPKAVLSAPAAGDRAEPLTPGRGINAMAPHEADVPVDVRVRLRRAAREARDAREQARLTRQAQERAEDADLRAEAAEDRADSANWAALEAQQAAHDAERHAQLSQNEFAHERSTDVDMSGMTSVADDVVSTDSGSADSDSSSTSDTSDWGSSGGDD